MKTIAAGAILAAVIATPALANDFYVVGSLGRSSMDIEQSAIDADLTDVGATNVSSSLDKHDTGYKLQLGYRINEHFAVEGGYVDLGEARYDATFTGGTARATVEVSGPNIALVGIMPVNSELSLFGKLGAINAKVHERAFATGPGGSATGSVSSTNLEMLWGVGASYDINRQFAVRLEYEFFNNLGDDDDTGEADVDLLSVGVVFKF